MKRRLIVIGPVPPPYHGVTISTSLVLGSERLDERFDVEHLDTSDHRPGRQIGTWDRQNIAIAVRSVAHLLWCMRGERGVVYLPVSQSAPGFLRDSLFIHLAYALRWKVAVHLRGSEFHSFHRSSPAYFRRWIEITLRRVSSMAVMGDSLKRVFEGLVPPERLAVVPNGTPEPTTNGVTRDANLVLFLSNLWRRKGVEEALEAALLVVRDRPSARVLFVGEWESPELERSLKQRAASSFENVEFLGTQTGNEKDKLLASSSVLLFPPREPEGHPRVVLEALAAGVPVVTTDRGAIADTVVDGECGYVLDRPEPTELAARVSKILEDPGLHARMSRSARNRYLASFTQEHADRRLVEWLEQVAGA